MGTEVFNPFHKCAHTSANALFDKSNASGFTNYRLYLDGSNRLVFSYDTPYSASAGVTDVTQGQAAFDTGTHTNTICNSGNHIPTNSPHAAERAKRTKEKAATPQAPTPPRYMG